MGTGGSRQNPATHDYCVSLSEQSLIAGIVSWMKQSDRLCAIYLKRRQPNAVVTQADWRVLPEPGCDLNHARDTRMKRHLNPLLQKIHSRFEAPHAARRSTTPLGTPTATDLRAEDGYDWLRQIKPLQREPLRTAPKAVSRPMA